MSAGTGAGTRQNVRDIAAHPRSDALPSTSVLGRVRSEAQPPGPSPGFFTSGRIKLVLRSHRAHADTSAGRRATVFSSAFLAGSVVVDGRESPLSQPVSLAAVGDTPPPGLADRRRGHDVSPGPLTPCDAHPRLTRVN